MPASTDVVIIGNGPSSMILSYILHGHIPFYDPATPHPDPLLHAKLLKQPQLLGLDIDLLTEHFAASRFSYSTQALPVNVLLDTLVRPNGDTDDAEKDSNIRWRYMPEKAVPHIVLGSSSQPGGQWTDNPTDASWEIQTLSYAGMLSLPGYTFSDHHLKVHGTPLPSFTRPTRREVTDYLAAYPAAVGIDDRIHCGETVGKISREGDGFYVGSHGIACRHLVLASGIFSELIPPRPLLKPLAALPKPPVLKDSAPLLVIGSGFTAADIIISTPKDQRIIHIFKWQPETRPSPLRSCHRQAYPEYAGMYRLMKRAATAEEHPGQRPRNRSTPSSSFLESREWTNLYEGLPNTVVTDVDVSNDTATVTFCRDNGETFSRRVSGLAYAVGRRGSLDYLDDPLQSEIVTPSDHNDGTMMVSSQTLRAKAFEDLEVTKNVFIVGSLTGDSLVRFAYGGCVYSAGKLVASRPKDGDCASDFSSSRTLGKRTANGTPVLKGIEGHNEIPQLIGNGHPLDRRKPSGKLGVRTGAAKPERTSWWSSIIRIFN
ncbi:hypothetical protein FQN54_001338 [Arachnomyces sp. PD_36]|nr:hypothetical protein FQN54_001338 [Arachnomyces sp. PD_36]